MTWERRTLGFIGLGLLLGTAHVVLVRSAYEAGRQNVLAAARVDTVVVERVKEKVAAAVQRTNVHVTNVKRTVAAADSQALAAALLAQQLPLVVDTFPAVQRLKAAVMAMEITTGKAVAQVDSLEHVLDRERAEVQLGIARLEAQLTEARVVIQARDETIVALKKRPGWGAVLKGTLLGIVIGGAAGVSVR